jgi:hypothetical protein
MPRFLAAARGRTGLFIEWRSACDEPGHHGNFVRRFC